MEKAQVTANRLQTERDDYQMDADRQREKCDKLQVIGFFLKVFSFSCPNHLFVNVSQVRLATLSYLWLPPLHSLLKNNLKWRTNCKCSIFHNGHFLWVWAHSFFQLYHHVTYHARRFHMCFEWKWPLFILFFLLDHLPWNLLQPNTYGKSNMKDILGIAF